MSLAPYMISNEEEYPTHHTDSKHDRFWTPFRPDLHLPQPTIIPPDKDSEGVPQDDSETSDPEGDPEVPTLGNKDTPRRVYFEEPPYDFSLPTSNQPADPPSQSETTDAAL